MGASIFAACATASTANGAQAMASTRRDSAATDIILPSPSDRTINHTGKGKIMSDLKETVEQFTSVLHEASLAGMRMRVSIDIEPDRDYVPMTATIEPAENSLKNRIELLANQVCMINLVLDKAGFLRPAYEDGIAAESLRPAESPANEEAAAKIADAAGTISPFVNGQKVFVKLGAALGVGMITATASYLNRKEWQYQVEWMDRNGRPVAGWYEAGELDDYDTPNNP